MEQSRRSGRLTQPRPDHDLVERRVQAAAPVLLQEPPLEERLDIRGNVLVVPPPRAEKPAQGARPGAGASPGARRAPAATPARTRRGPRASPGLRSRSGSCPSPSRNAGAVFAKILDQLLQRLEALNFFPVSVMPVITLPCLIVVTHNACVAAPAVKPVLEPVRPLRRGARQRPDRHLHAHARLRRPVAEHLPRAHDGVSYHQPSGVAQAVLSGDAT